MPYPHSDNKITSLVILIADDNQSDREMVCRAVALGKRRCEIKEVENGEELLAYLRRQAPYMDTAIYPFPDLVLLDINMPLMDGKAALSEIRSDLTLKHLPVIILTTSEREADVMDAYQLGVNAYIAKPADVDVLIKAIDLLQEFWFELVKLPSSIKTD